jgi:hypothetical protein
MVTTRGPKVAFPALPRKACLSFGALLNKTSIRAFLEICDFEDSNFIRCEFSTAVKIFVVVVSSADVRSPTSQLRISAVQELARTMQPG